MAEMLVLRLIHVVGGVYWVGAMLFTTFYLMPAMSEAGPAAAKPIMAVLQRRRMLVIMPAIALLTILSGLRLMWIVSGGYSATYFSTPSGATFGLAGLAAIIAFLLGLSIVRPASVRAGVLLQSLAAAPDDDARARIGDELSRLQRRSYLAGLVVAALLIVAASGMAVGQYMR